MNTRFEQHYAALQQWLENAVRVGWVAADESARLAEIEQQQAEALFTQRGERPLIVAFFGGTGVGKSSLLNRLAGVDIARVGVERPTSHEVTLFLHQDYELGELPAELPLAETLVAYHQDDRRRLTAWLDLPDIDSVEEKHRALVEAWLPYVDWLVYVVSPERYQDERGWRFVQERGGRHAWLFVMNQWDKGEQVQVDDFRARLQHQGVADPIILRTSCGREELEDDFHRLEATIDQAIGSYGLGVLQRFGLQARLRELVMLCRGLHRQLADFPLDALRREWSQLLAQRLNTLKTELQTNRQLMVQKIPQPRERWPWSKEAGADTQPADRQPAELIAEVWSERVGRAWHDIQPEMENALSKQGMPRAPYRQRLHALAESGQALFASGAETPLAQAMLQPGSQWQRMLYRWSGWLGWGLPLAVTLWVVTHLVSRFYSATQGAADFLGIDFVLHSALMIGLAWLLPWWLQRRLRPSLAQAMDSGLNAGIGGGLALLRAEGERIVVDTEADLKKQVADLARIIDEFGPDDVSLTVPDTEQWVFKEPLNTP